MFVCFVVFCIHSNGSIWLLFMEKEKNIKIALVGPESTGKSWLSEELAKHYAIVKRRMSAGQCFHQPYFGTREFPADFSWVERHEDIPHSELAEPERDLGYMLLDIDHGASRTPRFFRAVLKQGVMDVPPLTSEGVMS